MNHITWTVDSFGSLLLHRLSMNLLLSVFSTLILYQFNTLKQRKKQSDPVTRCRCIGQWRTRLTLTSCCWGTCWWGRTCRIWRTWRVRRTTKTTEPSASRIWRAWWCRRGNAGGWSQDARRSLDTLTSCILAFGVSGICFLWWLNADFSLLGF